MTTAPIKITTVDRILDASLKLFNEQGFHLVPAMRVAELLGISPGHLAYHFKNKRDILFALFPRLENALREVIQLDMSHLVPVSIDRNLNVLKILWNHRFFFIEFPQLVQGDSRLLDSFVALENRMLSMMESSYQKRVEEGVMQAIPAPNSTHVIAKCAWRSWIDWIRAEQIVHPGQHLPSRESVYEAMMVGYCLIQPYMSKGYLNDVVIILKERLTGYSPADVTASPTPAIVAAHGRKNA